MQIGTISSKRQLTLSKELLLQLGIQPGSKVMIESTPQGLLVKPLKTSIVEATAGSLTKYIDPKKLHQPF